MLVVLLAAHSTARAAAPTPPPVEVTLSGTVDRPALPSEPAWVRQMDRADRLYRTGRTMGLAGGGALLAGIAVVVVGVRSNNPGLTLGGSLIAFGGAASATYGGPVMLIAAGQATRAVEDAIQRPLPRGNITGGWVSFALLGGYPSYLFATAQWRLVMDALDYHGLLGRDRVHLVPTLNGLALTARF